LLKVKSEPDDFIALTKLIESSGSKIIDNCDSIYIVETTGDVKQVENLIKKLKKFNILEIMRSGKMAMVESGQDEHRVDLEETSGKKSWATQQISDALF
jgi:acetolactate synthase small subunit